MKKFLFIALLGLISLCSFSQGTGSKPADIVNGITSREDVRLKIDWAADEAEYASSVAAGNTQLLRNPTGTYTLAGSQVTDIVGYTYLLRDFTAGTSFQMTDTEVKFGAGTALLSLNTGDQIILGGGLSTLTFNSLDTKWEGIPIDESEAYLLAIDDATGLLSRRSAASLGGGGGGDLLSSNNLSDVANAATSVANLGLGNVENVALSTWSGSTSLVTTGIVTTGTWRGAIIENAYIPSVLTGKSVNGVTLSAAEASTVYLDGEGNYTVPAGGGGVSDHTLLTNIGVNTHPEIDAALTSLEEDTVTLGDVATIHSDARSFVFGLGASNPEDVGVMQTGAFMGGWFEATDTIVPSKIRAWCAGGTINCRIYYGTSPYTGGTSVTLTLAIAGGSEMVETSFNTAEIPPGNWIYCLVTSVGPPPEQVIVNMEYSRK